MLKFTKRSFLSLVVFVMFTVLATISFAPAVLAISLSNVRDVLSDSSPGTAANHKIFFTTSLDIGNNGYFEVTLPAAFGDISLASCQGPNVSVSTTTTSVRCTYSSSPGAATSTVISLNNVTNPSTVGSQTIEIKTYNSLSELRESATILIYINNNTTVRAVMESSMSFSVSTSTNITEINGIPLTGTSTPTSIPFGELTPGASSTLAQTLQISTNAENGYSCTVEEIHELTSAEGNTINSFDNAPDGSGSTTPHTWNAPATELGQTNTYGHMGITTDDSSLSSLDFTGGKFVGLNGGNPVEIMYHNAAADGNTQSIGLAHIGYSIEISNLQEPGLYTTTIMYICTPNF